MAAFDQRAVGLLDLVRSRLLRDPQNLIMRSHSGQRFEDDSPIPENRPHFFGFCDLIFRIFSQFGAYGYGPD